MKWFAMRRLYKNTSYNALSINFLGANCHNTTTCLITRAGGIIPEGYDPPDLGEPGQCPQ